MVTMDSRELASKLAPRMASQSLSPLNWLMGIECAEMVEEKAKNNGTQTQIQPLPRLSRHEGEEYWGGRVASRALTI